VKDFKVPFPYLLTSSAFLVETVCSAVLMMSNKIADLRTWLALALTATFIVCCIGMLALIIGIGNETMKIDVSLPRWLGGSTIAEVAGIVLIVVQFFFKSGADAGKVIH
jgi:hypothetical protein